MSIRDEMIRLADEINTLVNERIILLNALEEIAELNPSTPNEFYEVRDIARKAIGSIN